MLLSLPTLWKFHPPLRVFAISLSLVSLIKIYYDDILKQALINLLNKKMYTF